MTSAELAAPTSVVHKPLPHNSARLHVQGSAAYVDDIREPEGTLHVAIGMADRACGIVTSLDLSAVRAAPGVVAVLTAADIPGKNDIAPVFADEQLLADKEVMFHGQPVFAVVARNRDEARRAARFGKDRHRGAAAVRHRRRRAEDGRARSGRLRLRPRRRERCDRRGSPSFGGPVLDRRSGAFLSRGSGLARHSRRGRRDDRARLEPGSDGDTTYRRPRSWRPGRFRDGGDAANGRRLRRQGEPGLHLGRDGGARRAPHRTTRAKFASTATTISC